MPYIGKAPASGIRSRFIYTATAAQTTFTGADGNGKTLGYTDGEYVDVYLNGVLLDPADYTATSKTSVVLDSGATVSDIVEIVVYDTFSVFNGTFTGDLTVDGDTLFVDASADKVAMGTTSADADASVLSIKGTDPAQIYDGQIIIHGSATSGAADTGAGIGFKGHHGTGNRNLGAIQSLKENATSGNADAYMRFVTRSNSGGLAEAMRIDSSGNVGVGTTSPSAPFSNRALEVSGTGGNGGVKVIRSDAATAGGLSLLSGSTTHSLYGEGAKDLNFWTNATERMRILSGGGLTFNGDTATANALDDYEEGTFTPTYAFSGGGGSFSYSIQVGTYTKIGRSVFAQVRIRGQKSGTGSGVLQINGLPFTASNVTNLFGTGAIGFTNNWNNRPMGVYIEANNTAMTLTKGANSSNTYSDLDTTILDADLDTGSTSSNDLIFTIFFTT